LIKIDFTVFGGHFFTNELWLSGRPNYCYGSNCAVARLESRRSVDLLLSLPVDVRR